VGPRLLRVTMVDAPDGELLVAHSVCVFSEPSICRSNHLELVTELYKLSSSIELELSRPRAGEEAAAQTGITRVRGEPCFIASSDSNRSASGQGSA
jgi:hypothetical protein